MSPTSALLLVQVGATLAMVGLIWFVQVVHYPLFAAVGPAEFPSYEREHVRRTGWVVIPLMLGEAASALGLVALGGVPRAEAWLGLGLLVGVWASTFFLQVPLHARLEEGFDAPSQARLVQTNALRTALWTARGLLVLAWLGRALAAT